MAFKGKAGELAALRPDLAVVPECADPSLPDQAEVLPGRSANSWIGPNRQKGLSAWSFGPYKLEPLPRRAEDLPDALATRVSGPTPFTLVAVWTRGPTYIRRLHDVLDAWGPALRDGHTVMAGDFNSNAIWDQLHGTRSHSELVRRLREDFGLFSAYHAHRNEPHGAETTSTFFMHGKRQATYHIDYVFLPEAWQGRLTHCAIGPPERWLEFSDHCPMTVEVAD